MSVRLQERDWKTAEHLYDARALSTQQIADACFEGRFHATQARLYLLRKAGFLKNLTGHGRVGCVWELTKETFTALSGHDRSRKYPGPLGRSQVEHLISVNELYVNLLPLLQHVDGAYQSDWTWEGEPRCHREYTMEIRNGGRRYVLKPDAEVGVFGRLYLIERQTSRAKERPEKLHDKIFGYHRFANSSERKDDPREITLLWACDEERDARAALEARWDHPAKSLHELGMSSFHEERMPVQSGSMRAVTNFIYGEATKVAR